MAFLFRIVLSILTGVFATPLLAMLAEPFWSELLELAGIDTSLWARPAASFIREIVLAAPFVSTSLFIVGMAVGAWLDALLRQRDGLKESSLQKLRADLADRAGSLAQEVFTFYGEWRGQADIDWDEETNEYVNSARDRRPPSLKIRREAKFKERFAEGYLARSMGLIHEARKYITLEFGELWKLEMGARSAEDAYSIANLLQKISADLRNDMAVLPLANDPSHLIPAQAPQVHTLQETAVGAPPATAVHRLS